MQIKKGYKQTEIGVIPEDWEVKKLGEITEIDSDNLKSNTNRNYCFEYISLEDVEVGTLKNTTSYIFALAPSRARRKVKKKDILVSTVRPNLQSHFFVNYDVKNLICSTGFSIIRCNESSLDAKYIYFHFFSNILEAQINILLVGSNYPAINSRDIKNLKIPLPLLPEQQAIAGALSDVDALVSSLDQLITKKRNIKQGAMQELLKIKKHWEIKLLGEIGECIIGLTYSPENIKSDGLLVLRSSNIKGSRLAFNDNVYVNIEVDDKLKTKVGDILVCVRNGSRELIGKTALINKEAEGLTFGAFMSIYKTKYSGFVFHLFQSRILKTQIKNNLGATINQITNKDLLSFKIPFPPLSEQQAIAAILSDMDAEIEKLEQQRDKYKAIKQGMMQELLTGKTRLV